MIRFDSSKDSHVNGIVSTLAELYKGEPVGSAAIGRVYEMGHRQVLVYLHMAKDIGLATPVYSNSGGVIRGWVPEGVEVRHTLAEQKAIKAADAVKRLYAGDPVFPKPVAKHLDVPVGTVARWLAAAERMKLVRKPAAGRGWLPA